MRLFFTSMIMLSFLISCTNQGKKMIQSNVIDIENGLNNLTHFKVSDFGQSIRYIPLETSDDVLVGGNPVLKVLKNYIVIESQRQCLLFDKKNGCFVAEIGRYGQGPEEFSDNFSWTDEKEEFLYFIRRPNQLIKYDMQGKFSGNIAFTSPPGLTSYYLLTDSEIIGYFGEGLSQMQPFVLGVFDRDGSLKDSIPPLFPRIPLANDEVIGMNVFRGHNTYGKWAYTGVIIIDYKNDTRKYFAQSAARIWKSNENIFFKEDFVDTLYTISDNKLISSYIFNTGKYHWPVEDRMSKRNTNERVFVADVSDNNTFVFFQCIKGMNSDEPVLYNGLYDKKTGQTKLSNNSDAIEDDLTRFMPFIPLGISTSGEFVSLVEAWKVMEWLEKNPEAVKHANLSFLKELNAEMNPIVILVE